MDIFLAKIAKLFAKSLSCKEKNLKCLQSTFFLSIVHFGGEKWSFVENL
jgi:hypothetical protein